MSIKKDQLVELAALHSLGTLDGADARAFADLLEKDAAARNEAAAFAGVTEALVKALPVAAKPSPDLKERILRQAGISKARAGAIARIQQLLPQAGQEGLAFLRAAASSDWLPLPAAGAFVKLLSFDNTSGYAVVLGKLNAGGRYPSHPHKQGEDIFMLSGDLHVGDEVIRAGDFHRAHAGSVHGVNWSEEGCVLLAVLSKEDLLEQLVLG